jgi:hypothetical protein
VFIGSAHVFSANFPAELRQISLQYESIPADIFLVSIKIMLENSHILPMNTGSKMDLRKTRNSYWTKK